jgi:hypothetical protein
MGKVIINSLPLFTSLLTSILPLCKSTIDLTIVRPIPIPPAYLLLDSSTL